MKVNFTETNRDKVLANIKEALGTRKLAEIVDFTLLQGKLQVTISKLGTSTLLFSESSHEGGLEYTLSSEKIAFAHKALKGEVTSKIIAVIEKAGGKVS